MTHPAQEQWILKECIGHLLNIHIRKGDLSDLRRDPEKNQDGYCGAGIWGETHASIYNEHVLAEVAAICDTDKEKAQRVADKYGIKEVYTDYHELFQKADFDAAAIVTPDHLHADIAIACANSKRHMLIEKPLELQRRCLQNG